MKEFQTSTASPEQVNKKNFNSFKQKAWLQSSQDKTVQNGSSSADFREPDQLHRASKSSGGKITQPQKVTAHLSTLYNRTNKTSMKLEELKLVSNAKQLNINHQEQQQHTNNNPNTLRNTNNSNLIPKESIMYSNNPAQVHQSPKQ